MRFRSLDSLRGVAAFVVVLHHAFLALPHGGEDRGAILQRGIHAEAGWLYATPLRVLVAGPAAVILFFVLSGFVLTLSWNSSKPRGYPTFAKSRAIRIWVPFAVAIALSALLSLVLRNRPLEGGSDWLGFTWRTGATLSNLVRHLLMTGTAIDLDNPMWSLVHELRISLILPAMVFVARNAPRLLVCLCAFVSAVAALTIPHLAAYGLLTSLVTTVTLAVCFSIGILLATDGTWVDLVSRIRPAGKVALWICVPLVLSVAENVMIVPGLHSVLLLLTSSVSAGILIALCITSKRADKILTLSVPAYLGRISYSLYLTHVIVIAAMAHALSGIVPLPLTLVLAVPASLVTADIFYRCVEAPSHHLARRLTSGPKPSPSPPDQALVLPPKR